MEPAGPRACWPATAPGRASGCTTRSDTDDFTNYLYDQPTDFDVVERVAEVAAERGVPAAQVALAWLLHRPGVTAPIVGATKPGHLDRRPGRRGAHPGRRRRSARLEEPYVPHPVLGHF